MFDVPIPTLVGTFCLGWAFGAFVMWRYFIWARMLRTRKEWYADPIVKAKYGDDPNPGGWSY